MTFFVKKLSIDGSCLARLFEVEVSACSHALERFRSNSPTTSPHCHFGLEHLWPFSLSRFKQFSEHSTYSGIILKHKANRENLTLTHWREPLTSSKTGPLERSNAASFNFTKKKNQHTDHCIIWPQEQIALTYIKPEIARKTG